jgi:hypothetical protein
MHHTDIEYRRIADMLSPDLERDADHAMWELVLVSMRVRSLGHGLVSSPGCAGQQKAHYHTCRDMNACDLAVRSSLW